MGLGKTVQAVAASHALFKAGIVKRGLLLVPGPRSDPLAVSLVEAAFELHRRRPSLAPLAGEAREALVLEPAGRSVPSAGASSIESDTHDRAEEHKDGDSMRFPTPSRIMGAIRTLRHVLKTYHLLEGRVSFLAEQFPGQQWENSRVRWRGAAPSAGLTWGRSLSGAPFIRKAEAHGAFAPDRSILEIGPGYGRLLKALLESRAPFRDYTGIDLSRENVAYLQDAFSDARIRFLCADAESVSLDRPFDLVISSLTFKHFYPTFQKALHHLYSFSAPGALAIFDLVEATNGSSIEGFERDGKTFMRHYTRDEVRAILDAIGLRVEAYDTVRHDRDYVRLLVVARRPMIPDGAVRLASPR